MGDKLEGVTPICLRGVMSWVTAASEEPTVVDEVRTGTYRQLFHPEQLISGAFGLSSGSG